MNKTTSKVIQISDLVQWNAKGVIELSPKYQRNNVWNDNAKAYLIDTIIRGLPIPPIFLREKIDVYTKTTNREIIDGQQRVRAILEYVVDEKFTIKNSHNKEYGGKKYSDLDENSKEAILGFEIIAEVVVEKDESVIYDMFARLNSNNYVLNKQEIRNAKYWGDFKVLIYSIAAEYRDFFLRYGIFSDKECTRMKDVELVNSLVILLNEGIVEETPAFVNLGCLKNKNYFYTLFAVLYNQFYGIKNLDLIKSEELKNINNLKDIIANFLNDYIKVSDDSGMEQSEIRDWAEFKKNHKIRTTSKNERTSRISFLNSYFMR